MDARRALEVLGLSSPTSEEGLRRAYLKAVRAHGPERDPQGFSQVRAAYELLLGMQRMRGSSSLDAEIAAPAPESARTRLQQKAPPSWRAPASSPPARPSNLPPAPAAAPHRFTRSFADADYAGAARQLLNTWTEDGCFAAAPADVLTCALRLFEAGEVTLSTELLRGFEATIQRAGLRPGTFGSPLIARWMLLCELAALPGEVGPELLSAFAAAVRSGRYRRAGRVLARALTADSSLFARLRRVAPALFAATPIAGREDRESHRPTLSTAAGPT